MISNNAKLYCMLGGVALSVSLYLVTPHSNYKEMPVFARDYNEALDTKQRTEERRHVLAILAEPGDACDAANRKSARNAVTGYYGQRARRVALAERYLAPANTERVVQTWSSADDKRIEEAILVVAKKGSFTRDDFRPTTYPELAALLEGAPTTTPNCES